MRRLASAVLIALFVGSMGPAASASAREPMRGRSLDEVLADLAEVGVQVVYTERLVRPDMRVELEPVASEPFKLLNQLLIPHALRAEPAVGGRFRVVPGPVPIIEEISGQVVSALHGLAVEGAVLSLDAADFELVIRADGQFQATLHSAFYSLSDPLVVRVTAPGFETHEFKIARGQGKGLDLRLDPVIMVGEKVEVRASRPWILGESLSSLVLEREDLLALPHVGNDVFRSLTLLPGVSSNDVSAQLSVRGGRTDELLIRLDGVEILEPYHLRDFNSFLSILSPQIIDHVELLTGGFSAEFGDRMSGVLDLTTVEAEWRQRRHVGITLFDLELGASGKHAEGDWLITLRGGTLEVPFRFADEVERPAFGDVFVKLDRDLNETRSLRGSVLLATDRLVFSEFEDDEQERFKTRYSNAYTWISDHKVVNDSLFFETRVSATRIDRDRQALEQEDGTSFDLRDDRSLISTGISQDWHKQWGERSLLKWGADIRRLEASYGYFNERQFEDPLARIRALRPEGTTSFEQSFRGWQYAGYLSNRIDLSDKLAIELGLRFDRNTVLDDNHIEHPRLSATFQLTPRARLQAAWGQYAQSQRLYELQVEDGVTEFAETEQADYGSLGFETTFPGAGIGSQRRPITLRLELYRRKVGNPRLRFENLFDPISKVPELEADRFPFIPEETLSEGAELFLGGAIGRRVDWFAGYSYADASDRIVDADGSPSKVPRSNDQTHTLRVDVAWHTPWLWDVHIAWRSHTGWPTTAVSAGLETIDGESVIVPTLGPIHGERLSDYHRMDLRLSRHWARGKLSDIEFFFQVQNLLGRGNLRGYDVGFETLDDGSVDVTLDPETWGRVIPTVGLRWRF